VSDIEPRVLVLGIGNILMLDEGVGNRVAVELEKNYQFPDDVRIMDAGTMGLGMIHLFRGVEFLLVVDAMDGSGHPPGTVVRIAPEEFAPNQVMHSLHDIRFVDVLEAAKLIGLMPEADCIGIQVQEMNPAEITIGLSEPVEAAVPRAVAASPVRPRGARRASPAAHEPGCGRGVAACGGRREDRYRPPPAGARRADRTERRA